MAPPMAPPMAPGASEMPPEMMAAMMGGGGPQDMAGPPPPETGGIAGAPPMAMARGGYVQNFQVGSDEDGVTPAGSPDLVMYPPDMVAAARKSAVDLFNQQPIRTPTLTKAMESRLPEYTKLLGSDRGASEAQMLFDLGQRAFGFGSNVDDQGRPLRGSFVSRLAGAARTLPSAMGKRIDEIAKIDRQIKALALQQGEKDIDQVTAQNTEYQKRRAALVGQVLTAQGRIDAKKIGGKEKGPLGPNPFGTGDKGLQLQMISEFAPLYAAGSLLPQEERNFLTNVKDYTQERRTRYTDPQTGLIKEDIQQNKLPDFVMEALGSRRPGKPVSSTGDTSSTGTTTGTLPATSTAARAPVLGLTPTAVAPEVYQVASTAPKSSFFDLAATGTGFVPVLVAGVARNVPLSAAGNIGPEFQQSTAMLESMTNRVVNTLQENPRFAEGERKQILDEVRLAPKLFSNKNGYINSIIALDNVLEGIEKKTFGIQSQEKTGIQARQAATKKLEEISAVRDLLGIQQRTVIDPSVWKALPPGEYIVVNPQTGFKQLQIKYDGPQR